MPDTEMTGREWFERRLAETTLSHEDIVGVLMEALAGVAQELADIEPLLARVTAPLGSNVQRDINQRFNWLLKSCAGLSRAISRVT